MAEAFAVVATLALEDGIDPRSVGAAVTVELCGDWDHPGPCRWPHNNELDAALQPAEFRTLYVADEHEAHAVRIRIEDALRGGSGWRVLSVSSRPVADTERPLAQRLLADPRRAA
jgi:mannose/cellobiose epimerase-like protein (N-acyl-D-glucosamine 2-epimerase family)